MSDYRLSIVIMAKIKFILQLKIVVFDGINFVKDVLVSSNVITIAH